MQERPARGREVDPDSIMGYRRYHRNQRAASPLASAFILAEGAAGVVSSTVWREAQNITCQRKAPATNSMCLAKMD
jgi:hypothetical protein